ncbi:MAG: type II toxin-antitoxin system VapC family toxin [Streptosporangiaceae bacterium]
MIIVDTNVLSELIRQAPDPGVVGWVDSLPATEVATTAITAAELLFGVGRLPDGRRKTELADAVHALLHEDFRERIEPFDTLAAVQYAAVVSDRERLGRPITISDAQIAAICRAHHATLASRNVKDFEDTGVEVIDPWHPPAHHLDQPGE